MSSEFSCTVFLPFRRVTSCPFRLSLLFLLLLRVGLEEGRGQIREANEGAGRPRKWSSWKRVYLQVLREILSEERLSPAAMREKLSYRCTLHNLSPRNALPSAGWRGSSRIFRRDEATSIESLGIVTCVYSLLLVCRVNNTMHEPSIKRSAIKTQYILRILPNTVEISARSAKMFTRESRLKDLYV